MDEKPKEEDVKDIDRLIKVVKEIQSDIKHMREQVDALVSHTSQMLTQK